MLQLLLAEMNNKDVGRILGRLIAPMVILGAIALWKSRRGGKSE